MVRVRSIDISPPLINTSCAWASDLAQLTELYNCPHIGAVTTRTATLKGFQEDGTQNVVFAKDTLSSLNSYGYSPHPLASYLAWVRALLTSSTPSGEAPGKPFIISIVASTPNDLATMLEIVQEFRESLKGDQSAPRNASMLIAVEFNTSCPNIKNKPPPSYDFPSLSPLLDVMATFFRADPTLTIGLKLPPYFYNTQYAELIQVLSSYTTKPHPEGEEEQAPVNPFAFLTSTNTLGSSLLFPEQVIDGENQEGFALPTGLGGLAGEAIHALSLGNVFNISQGLASCPDTSLKGIVVIGAGGVVSTNAVDRMRKAGAQVVGCATLLGSRGVRGFEQLLL